MSEPASFEMLATYNAEVARGIVHTPEWAARMVSLQREFDARVEAEFRAAQRPDGTFVLPMWWPAGLHDAARRIIRRGGPPRSGERPSGT